MAGTVAYGAATRGEKEKFFADPVRGSFAVVEAFGANAEKLAQKVSEIVAGLDPAEEQFLSLLQYQVGAALKDYAGKAAVSLALVYGLQGGKMRWLRTGASGISLLAGNRFLPVAVPQVANPRALAGHGIAIPGAALGIGGERWEQGYLAVQPGESVALHTSGFPVFSAELTDGLGLLLGNRLPGETFQPATEALISGSWCSAGTLAKSASLVVLEAPAAEV